MALQKMRRLNEFRVMRGTGTGNILLGFFQVALKNMRLEEAEADWNGADWDTHFLYPLLRFCNDGVSGECIWQRLMHPLRWCQSWTTEILHYFRRVWPDDRFAHLQSPHCRFEYLLSLLEEGDPLVALNTDSQISSVAYHPHGIVNVPIDAVTPLSARVCASCLETPVACVRRSDGRVLYTKSCIEKDPFGSRASSPHIIIDSLPMRYTLRQRAALRDQPHTSLISAVNTDWNAAYGDDELCILDIMTLFDRDSSGWESVPYFILVHAVNWGYAMTYHRLAPEVQLHRLYIHENTPDTYGILDISKAQLP